MSPGVSAVKVEIVAISLGMEKISLDKSDSCTVSPLSTVRIPAWPISTSSGVTRYGPSGVLASQALPCIHWCVLYW